jgi:hypothetical protein
MYTILIITLNQLLVNPYDQLFFELKSINFNSLHLFLLPN